MNILKLLYMLSENNSWNSYENEYFLGFGEIHKSPKNSEK